MENDPRESRERLTALMTGGESCASTNEEKLQPLPDRRQWHALFSLAGNRRLYNKRRVGSSLKKYIGKLGQRFVNSHQFPVTFQLLTVCESLRFTA